MARVNRIWRSEIESIPPYSLRNNSSISGQLTLFSFNFPVTIFATVIKGLTAGFSFKARALASISKGIPFKAKALASDETVAPGDRTMTAISDQGIPDFKWALLN